MGIPIRIQICFQQEIGKHSWLIDNLCLKMELHVLNEGDHDK